MSRQEDTDEFPLATELAWEYVEKVKTGKHASLSEYLAKLPDEENRSRFLFLANMHALAESFADAQATLELREALSELPKHGPDIARG